MEKINFIEIDSKKDNSSDLIENVNSKKYFGEFKKVRYNKIDPNNINYLALYIRHPFNFDEIIERIPNNLFLAMQNGTVRPLIIMITEQWDLFDTYAWKKNKFNILPDLGNIPYFNLIKHFISRAIPEENITWLVPDNNYVDQIKFLKDKGYKIKTKFLQYDYFLETMKVTAKNYNIPNKIFNKHYNCLCRGVPRNHRYGIIYSLWEAGLVDKGNVSCEAYKELKETKHSKWVDDLMTTESFLDKFSTWQTKKQTFKASLPMHYDHKVNQHWDLQYSFWDNKNYDESHIFEEAFLWIASETKKEQDGVYITEKTWKAIAYGSPFCINGDNGSLDYLKSMGYKTFSDFWDETYDQDSDINKIKKITNIVKNICDKSIEDINLLYQDMMPILKHNQKVMLENNQHDNLIMDLTKQNG